jgi:hypothetical protein
VLTQYNHLLENYNASGTFKSVFSALRKISSFASARSNQAKERILHILVEAARILLLSPFEIVVWKIYLERLWATEKSFTPMFFLLTAFAAKCEMNEDTTVFSTYLCLTRNPRFNVLYQDFATN